MADYSHRTLIFVITVMYSMEEKWRGTGSSLAFEDILSGRLGVYLSMAWLKLMKEGLFGEFSDDLYLNSFKNILSVAYVQNHLIRLGGSDLAYHLDEVSPRVIQCFLRQYKIPAELVEKASARLNALLDEQAKVARPQPNI